MARKRSNIITLYLNDKEVKTLDKRVAEAGSKNRNDYIRKAIITGGNTFIIKTDSLHNELRKITNEVGRIGVNVNQIAKRINSTGSIYRKDMEEILEAYQLIVRLLTTKVKQIDKLDNITMI